MKKITRSTFKSFINKNKNQLYCLPKSTFDGMIDCVMPTNSQWQKASATDKHSEHTMGIEQVWLVGQSRDYFNAYDDGKYQGIEYHNCCGNGIVAITK